jgi:hypothetical protein
MWMCSPQVNEVSSAKIERMASAAVRYWPFSTAQENLLRKDAG